MALAPAPIPAPSFDRLHLPAGAVLFRAGEPGSAAYLIERGCLEIVLDRPEGDLLLARRGLGEIVGEMAILDARPRSATVRAVEDCTLVAITEAQIRHRLAQTDPILRLCLGVVIERYRETVALLGGGQPAPTGPAPIPPGPRRDGTRSALETLVLERELRAALERGELELFFQPIVELGRPAPARLAGFEALMRWRRPDATIVGPGQFIPMAEASGLIGEITAWALEEVGRVLPEIMLAGLANPAALAGPLFLSVNVSGQDLMREDFVPSLAGLLDRTGIAPLSLKLEVTESTLMQDPERAAAALAACREAGMGVAIDDFGTGYSSLSYLSTLPITTLKIDRAFVRAMLADPVSRKIVATILRLADELAIPVVAEGIEQPDEAEALVAMGCAHGQGYLYGRPVPLDATLALIRGWAAAPMDGRLSA